MLGESSVDRNTDMATGGLRPTTSDWLFVHLPEERDGRPDTQGQRAPNERNRGKAEDKNQRAALAPQVVVFPRFGLEATVESVKRRDLRYTKLSFDE
jgi:hypothetical protein